MVDVAQNGQDGFDMVIKGEYDIVFMDKEMPVMDGFEATRRIRQWEQKENKNPIPIVSLTAHALIGSQEEALAAGCTEFLTKPFKKQELLTVIEKYQNW